MTTKKISVVGIGPGSKGLITSYGINLIEKSDVLIGGKRNLSLFQDLNKETLVIGNNFDSICQYMIDHGDNKKIVVLATGDPGIFSIAEILRKKLKDMAIEVVPGISSIQYFCSQLGINWSDMKMVSLHGRECTDLEYIVQTNKKTAIFTGGGTSSSDVCKRLIDKGIKDLKIIVGERLSYPDERITWGRVDEIGEMEFDSLSIMIVEHPTDENREIPWPYQTSGIPDHMFIRGDVPMTKSEIRAVALSKLELTRDSIIYDIGAGTGSVTIECGFISSKGRVYAIEKSKEGIQLIRKNVEKFNLTNVEIIEGEAPEILRGLPKPNRIFIGGTGRFLEEILAYIDQLDGELKIVINTITIESTYETIKGLEKINFDHIEVVNLSVARGYQAGSKHLMKALNPVYIISAERGMGR